MDRRPRVSPSTSPFSKYHQTVASRRRKFRPDMNMRSYQAERGMRSKLAMLAALPHEHAAGEAGEGVEGKEFGGGPAGEVLAGIGGDPRAGAVAITDHDV